MSGLAPWVHKFRTRENRYVLDVNTNRVLRVDPVTWDIADEFGTLSEREIVEKYSSRYTPMDIVSACGDIVRAQKDSGLLLPQRAELAASLDREAVRDALESKRKKLTLGVTKACNFRCDYCVYGEQYPLWPKHSKRNMSWAVAKRAIDDYLAHSHNYHDSVTGEHRLITFYGGEPLLNASIIKQCIAYARELVGSKVIFHLSTNGYLLNGSIAEYLASEKVTIQVSLDGPRHVHDRHRHTADGAPTWQRVIENVRQFLSKHPEYHNTDPEIPCLSINATLSPLTNALEINEFFGHQLRDLLGVDVDVHCSKVTPRDSNFVASLAPEDRGIPGTETLYRRFLASAKQGLVVQNPRDRRWIVLGSLWQDSFQEFLQRKLAGGACPALDGRARLGCMCIPGGSGFFVAADGRYYPCVKVPPCDTFRIGDVWNGLDVDKAYHLKRTFEQLVDEDCRDCWCVNLCHVGCLVNTRDGEKLTVAARRAACERHRTATHDMLVDLYNVLEVNPSAFNHLKKAQGA